MARPLDAELARPFHERVLDSARAAVIGQEGVLRRLLVGLLTGGHVLLEGVPGLAKTRMVRAIARAVSADFSRIQFTPDLLPADILGGPVYRPETGEFSVVRGPVFTQFLLADEINRAPPKVQSALLEAMEEGQVSLGGETLLLPEPFLVLATQNPLDQHGTYPLSEAQLDRFMMRVRVEYPSREEELSLLRDRRRLSALGTGPPATLEELDQARERVLAVHVDPGISAYIVDLVRATRAPAGAGLPELEGTVRAGASPRAALFLEDAARAWAFLQGRPFVTPDDVKALAPDVLEHRLVLGFEAGLREIDSREVVARLLRAVRAP